MIAFIRSIEHMILSWDLNNWNIWLEEHDNSRQHTIGNTTFVGKSGVNPELDQWTTIEWWEWPIGPQVIDILSALDKDGRVYVKTWSGDLIASMELRIVDFK